MSWYDIVLRLKLPDLLNQQQRSSTAKATIMENLVLALMRESSVRNRQEVAVVASGLAAVPSRQALPSFDPLLATTPSADRLEPLTLNTRLTRPHSSHDYKQQPPSSVSQKKKISPSKDNHSHSHSNSHSSSALHSAQHLTFTSSAVRPALAKMSSEKWIPFDRRSRSLQRQMMTVKALLEDSRTLERATDRGLKLLSVSELEQSKKLEQLQCLHHLACGCCQRLFLPVNLPMKVSAKAVLDLRAMRGGKVTSLTVFGTPRAPLDDDGNEEGEEEGDSPSNKRNSGKPSRKEREAAESKRKAILERAVPRCYDQVGVCVFCAQFFAEPDRFRPAFATIVAGEKRTAAEERRQREREYWDPLRMVEKDREAMEKAAMEQMMIAATANTAAAAGGGVS